MKNKFSLYYWYLLLTSILCGSISEKSAAQVAISSDHQNNPAWVQMMSDPNVNYYEAVKAFDEYWKHLEMPEEEDEKMGKLNKYVNNREQTKAEYERQQKQKIEAEGANIILTEAEMKELEWKREMTYQVKRFKDWKRTVKPYVQNDGRILNEEERMKIYEQRQDELRKDK